MVLAPPRCNMARCLLLPAAKRKQKVRGGAEQDINQDNFDDSKHSTRPSRHRRHQHAASSVQFMSSLRTSSRMRMRQNHSAVAKPTRRSPFGEISCRRRETAAVWRIGRLLVCWRIMTGRGEKTFGFAGDQARGWPVLTWSSTVSEGSLGRGRRADDVDEGGLALLLTNMQFYFRAVLVAFGLFSCGFNARQCSPSSHPLPASLLFLVPAVQRGRGHGEDA
jgi:hypothetical protein